ncbi:peptide-methionine (R)-S-oxide reductase MsrB [Tellurirhabdus bombi]|uniref:peptide-methionine (R)-S-oxide reductase MsrB n=1 Tax=Tellurirhabdus bombi TaxID=2907205 RepID=UPI001F204A36|nr:peptide-methionine (R)-S-oxide reductase MsrB [Tellurirhabdus bombi]
MKKSMNGLAAFLLAAVVIFMAFTWSKSQQEPRPTRKWQVSKPDAEWKKILTKEQYYILRERGTEMAYSSPLNKNKAAGDYRCAACKTPLFSSAAKFESGTGWPSFYQPINKKNVVNFTDQTHGMVRTEVVCGICGGHLGHVFNDGPEPTGLRYCLNGDALEFAKK